MIDKIKIRKVRIEDLLMLLPLAEQLGYPIEISKAKKRLAEILKRKDDIFLVAEDSHKKVVGFIHGLKIIELLTPKTLRLAGIVVDKHARQKGIGRLLMTGLEKWAKQNHFEEILVPSNTKRRGAAKFYQKIGYPKIKTQNVFIKKI